MNYSQYLDNKQIQNLSQYVNKKLQNDLNIFEDYFGYPGNENLAIWLVITNVFEMDSKRFEGLDKIKHQIIPKNNFISKIKSNKERGKHSVNLYGIPEFIPMLSPFKEIGMDGIGGYYFINFLEKNPPVLYYEHEEDRFYKIANYFDDILQHFPIQNIKGIILSAINEFGENIQLPTSSEKINHQEILDRNDYFFKMIKGINHVGTKPFYSEKIEHPFTPFKDGTTITKQYNHLRNFYWYLFTGQTEELKKLVNSSKNIKGVLGNSIRNVFKEISEGNFKYLRIQQKQLEKIRGKNTLKGTAEYKAEAKAFKNKPPYTELFKEELEDDLFNGKDSFFIRTKLDDIEFIKNFCINAGHVKSLSFFGENLPEAPKEIQFLKNCETLGLSGNNTEKIPAEIGKLQHLKQLTISNNLLKDLPKEIKNLQNLEILNAGTNQFEKIPDSIKTLPSIIHLSLCKNIIKSIPSWIHELHHLRTLDLWDNEIEIISPEIGLAKSIQKLSIFKNKIKTLPDEIGGMDSLEVLLLGDNEITELPKGFYQLKNLKTLDISNTPIQILSKEIGNMTSLESLNFNKTQLKSFPKELGDLKNIKQIVIHAEHEKLIPESLQHIRDKFSIRHY